jgi:hypothetical protein
MRVGGVDVYLHWSVMVVGCAILRGAFERPAETLIAWTCYFGVLLIHEYGHVVVAQKKGCQVYAIELYPIHGLVRYSHGHTMTTRLSLGEGCWRKRWWGFLW